MDDRTLQMLMQQGGPQQQVFIPSADDKKRMEEAQKQQLRAACVQLAVQSGAVTGGGDGLVELAATIERYIVNGHTTDAD